MCVSRLTVPTGITEAIPVTLRRSDTSDTT